MADWKLQSVKAYNYPYCGYINLTKVITPSTFNEIYRKFPVRKYFILVFEQDLIFLMFWNCLLENCIINIQRQKGTCTPVMFLILFFRKALPIVTLWPHNRFGQDSCKSLLFSIFVVRWNNNNNHNHNQHKQKKNIYN